MPPGVDEHSSATFRKFAATVWRVDSELSLKKDSNVSAEPDSAASAAELAILAHAWLALVMVVLCEDEQSDCRVVADVVEMTSAKTACLSFMLR